MKLETALRIAKELAAQHRRWGKQLNSPYTPAQLIEAIAVLDSSGRFDTDIAEELTKTKRQLAALNARYQKLLKQSGQTADD